MKFFLDKFSLSYYLSAKLIKRLKGFGVRELIKFSLLIFYFMFFEIIEAEEHPLNFEMPDGERLVVSSVPFLADPSAMPSTLIDGRVNAITGHFTEVQQDLVVPGVHPFILERIYSYGIDKGSLAYGWDHNHAEMLASQYGKRHNYIVTKGKGTQLVYASRDKESRQSLHPDLIDKGLTNCRGEISGKTNLKNNRVHQYADYGRSLTTGSGTVSKFVKHNKYYYLRDILTDKRQRYYYQYGPDQNRLINKAFAQDDKGKNWGTFSFSYPTEHQLKTFAKKATRESPQLKVESEDGRSVTYTLKSFKRPNYNHEELIRFVVTKVDSTENPPVEYEYSKPDELFSEKLTAIRWPENRYLLIEYDLFHLPDSSPRVKTLWAPVGKDTKPIPLYSFEYKDYVRPDSTLVKDALGRQTIYRYSKDKHRLHSIEKYRGRKNYSLHSSEKYQWGKGQDKGNLTVKSLEDAKGKIVRSQKYQYDLFGNILQEELSGRLKGRSIDTYVKTMTYDTKGGFNNKLSSEDSAVRYEYQYAPGTSLCTARYTIDHAIVQRDFFTYDEGGAILEEIHDDGSGSKVGDWTGISERRYKAFVNLSNGLPKKIEEGYFDVISHKKVPLKTTVNSYDSLSRLIQEDVYNAQGEYVYSKKWEYNNLGLVTKETNPLKEEIIRTFDANGNMISESNPHQIRSFKYDFANRLIQTEQGSQIERFEYDTMGQKISSTDIHGNETHYVYDSLGRLSQKIYPDQGIEEYTYDVLGNVTSRTTPKGNKTHYKNTLWGKPYKKILPNGDRELFEYNLKGDLVKFTATDGTTTLYTLDYASRPLTIEIVDSQGKSVAKTIKKYNAFHLLEEIDPAQHVTRYIYDGAGRLIKEQCEDQITEYSYDALGRRSQIRKFASITDYVDEFLEYDLLDRITRSKIIDSQGHIEIEERFEYDFNGNKTLIAKGSVEERFSYDPYNRLEERIDSLGNTTRYLYEDNPHTVTTIDPKGNRTIDCYDTRGRVFKTVWLDAQKQLAERTQLFDSDGNKIQQVDNRIVTNWEYDPCNNVTALIEAVGTKQEKKTSYTYVAGRLHQMTKPSGIVLTYIYDSLGRLQELSSSDQSIHYVYKYEIAYRPTLTVYDLIQGTETKRLYDQNNWLSSETLANHSTLTYSYDRLGRQTKLTLPDHSSIETTYHGSRLNEVRRLDSAGVSKYAYRCLEYTPSGKLALVQLPSGIFLKQNYDPCDRLIATITPVWEEKDIIYDPCGNLIQKMKASFSYDPFSQLTSEKGNTFENQFSNDRYANHLVKNGIEQQFNALHQPVQLPFNANGNLTQLNDCIFEYDALDRLIRVNTPSQQITYVYDPFNRRISKRFSDGTQQQFIYAKKHEIGSIHSSNSLNEFKVLADAEARFAPTIALELDHILYTPLTDVQGNIAALLDVQGHLVEQYFFSAFGEEESNSPLSPWRFASKRHDPETNLIYFGERYYSPTLCRWITPDPLGLIDGINPYAYLHNNPFKYRDADGRMAFVIVPFVVSWGVELTVAATLQFAIDIAACATVLYFKLNSESQEATLPPLVADDAPTKRGAKDVFPGNVSDVEKNPDWEDTTHPQQKATGKHLQYKNKKTGDIIRYDKGDPSAQGHEANDHYHWRNEKLPKREYYDVEGNIVQKGKDAYHLYPPEGMKWDF